MACDHEGSHHDPTKCPACQGWLLHMLQTKDGRQLADKCSRHGSYLVVARGATIMIPGEETPEWVMLAVSDSRLCAFLLDNGVAMRWAVEVMGFLADYDRRLDVVPSICELRVLWAQFFDGGDPQGRSVHVGRMNVHAAWGNGIIDYGALVVRAHKN